MRPADGGPEHLDEDVEAAHGRQCVRQQGDGDVPAGQPLRHDTRADDDGEQQCRSKTLREEPL